MYLLVVHTSDTKNGSVFIFFDGWGGCSEWSLQCSSSRACWLSSCGAWAHLPLSMQDLSSPQVIKSAPLQRIYLQCRRLRFNSWFGKIPCRRKWQPTSVFLPGESHGQRNLATVHGVARVGHDSAIKPPLPHWQGDFFFFFFLPLVPPGKPKKC